MYKVIGIYLVVSEEIGGAHLIFRYPTVARTQVSNETMQALLSHTGSTSKKAMNDTQKYFSVHTPHKEREERPEFLLQQVQSIIETLFLIAKEIMNYPPYNMPSVLIAPLLLPKPKLCENPFEIAIDNVTFVGYPVSLSKLAKSPHVQGISYNSVISISIKQKNAETNSKFSIYAWLWFVTIEVHPLVLQVS
jgi:hypothetical protein